MKDKLAFALLFKILDIVLDSGANRVEAECALRAALELLPEANIGHKPTVTVSE